MYTTSQLGRAGVVLLLAWAGPAGAQLALEPAVVELGRVSQQQVFERTAKLTNVGGGSVEILDVRADCACTTALPRIRRLAPGESTLLSIVVESRGYQGEVTRRITVMSTAGEAQLTVRMNVAPFAEWNISALPVVFSTSAFGQEAAQTVRLTPIDGGDVALLGVTSDVPWLEAVVKQVEASPGYELRLTKRPRAPAGMLSAVVNLQTTSRAQPVLAVPVRVSVQSAVRVTPNPVVLPAARVGATASVSFTISGWTGKGGPQFSVGDGKVVPAEAEGNPQRFNLTMRVLQPGTQIRTLHVTDELGPQVDVPVVVRAAP